MKDVTQDDLTKKLPLSARGDKPTTEVRLSSTSTIGGKEIAIIAGPCAVESQEQIKDIAKNVKITGATAIRGGVYKPLTFPYPALFNYPDLEKDPTIAKERLTWLSQAGKQEGLPVVTEVMHAQQVDFVSQYTDVLQVGARNMQNIELLIKVGKTNKPVLLKRHPGMSLRDFLGAAEWILAQGNKNVILCERGVSAPHTHNPNSRFLPDIAAIAYLKKFTHLPVIFDPSHSTFERSIVAPMARAAIAAGADGIIIDVHPIPEKASVDPLQALNYENFAKLTTELQQIARAIRQ